MKKLTLTALALAFGLATASTGLAADTRPMADRTAFTLGSDYLDSKYLVGMRVVTPDGDRVGEIDHLIINNRDGKVSHAIVGLGGLAGIGERHVVVPWSQVKITRNPKDPNDRNDVVATIDRATLDSAPRYARTDRDRTPAASPATAPTGDRDRDGVRNNKDRAPDNPKKN